MRGRISFVGAVARGLVMFTAMTASLAVALFIAITGPPSNDEMRGLRIAGDAALAKFEQGARALGDAVCAQLPRKWKRAAACAGADAAPVQQAKVEPPPATPLPPDTVTPQPTVQIAATPEPESPLLGAEPAAPAASVPVVMEPVHVRASTPPRVRAHVSRTTRATAHRPVRRATATARRATTRAHPPPPHRQAARPHAPPAATPVVRRRASPPAQEPAHTTAVVAPAEPPPVAEPVVAVPHPQLAAPEPHTAAAPPSAAPPDPSTSNDASGSDPPLEKRTPTEAQTF